MIPLINHSVYSLLKGTATIDNLIAAAKKYKLPALALSDENGMYGLINFYRRCTEENIQPIIGTHITDPVYTDEEAVLLARNDSGYKDLCKIITYRKLNEDFELHKIIGSLSTNLLVISGSINLLKKLGGYENIFVPLLPAAKFRARNREIYNFALSRNIKCIAANPVYFLEKEDYFLHKVLTAIRLNTTLDNIDSTDLADEEFYFRDPAAINGFFRNIPEVLGNTSFIAEQCRVDLKLKNYKFPLYPGTEKGDSFSFLWKTAFDGLRQKYNQVTGKAEERLIMELNVIHDLGFSDYFLVVWDIVKEARSRGMMMIGRGSAANSLTAYCLGLTQVDPLKYNLYFERFLNRGRSSPPDFDIDFSWKERDEIVKYVFEKYGYENVAMISTHVTFRAKSAFRETAKVFGLSNNEISKFSKFIPWTNAQNLPNIKSLFPESKSLDFSRDPWKTIVKTASRIAGFPRHLSIHPGGIIITPTRITDYLALEYASNKGLGLIITQPDMYSVEEMGLIKIDLLSQRSLGVLRDTVTSINKGKAKS